jgi:hypothetical protein
VTGEHRTPPRDRINPWAFVGGGIVAAATFLGGVALVPDDDPGLRSAMLGVLIVAGTAAVGKFLGGRVDGVREDVADVRTQVNGRMTQLIEALRDAERRAAIAEARVDVSRETKPDWPPAR